LTVALQDDAFALEGLHLRRRTPEERAQWAAQRQARREVERTLQPLLDALQRLRLGHRPARQAWQQMARDLQDWLDAGAPDDLLFATLLAKTARHRPPGPRDAAELLVELGYWDLHDDPALHVSGLLRPPAAVQGLPSPGELPPLDLPWLAIDNDDPHEIDDAVYAEAVDGGTRLWVAIALPTQWFGPDDPIDREAMRRGATFYHPRHVAGMLPDTLAQDAASLHAGQWRPALVLAATVDGDGHWTAPWLGERMVRVRAAIRYRDADRWLDGEGGSPDDTAQLALLARTTRALERQRIAAGAYLLYKPDVEVHAPRHQRVQLVDASQSSPARRIVSEAMVLAGALAAQYGATHRLALPYRHQPPLLDPPLPAGLYCDALQVHALLRCLQPGQVALQPQPHGVMGLAAYVQVTSPLRRYADILAHRQLQAHLRGQPLGDGAWLLGRLAEAERGATLRRQTQRRAVRYFKLQWLAEQGPGLRLAAVVVRPLARGWLAFLPRLALEVPLQHKGLHLGDGLELQLRAVHPATDQLEVAVL
jgi:exoribonuclease-2